MSNNHNNSTNTKHNKHKFSQTVKATVFHGLSTKEQYLNVQYLNVDLSGEKQ